ncbi:MAG: hypothetical protein IPM24_20505 [Bryobacterales bacterium]|nr:hypothetical protein [Bryobacterales bacterium]
MTAQTNTLLLGPSSLQFTAQQGGPVTAGQQISITTTAAGQNFVAFPSYSNPGQTWISLSAFGGVTPGTLTVTVNPAGLAPGVYTGAVTVNAGSIQNSPSAVSITLTVTGSSDLSASPNQLSFFYQAGAAAPPAQTLSVTSTGGAVSFSATASGGAAGQWLAVNPVSGTTPRELSVSLNTAVLTTAGTFNGSVTIVSASGTVVVPVTVTVSTQPSLQVTPATLSFFHQIGVGGVVNRGISLNSSGSNQPFNVQVTTSTGSGWLVVTPLTGATPANLVASVLAGGLAAGTYQGNIRITSASFANTPVDIPVTLQVSPNPLIGASPAALTFNHQTAGATPGAQAVSLTSTGAQLNYQVQVTTETGQGWLTAGPSTGSTPGSITVGVNPVGLLPGEYNGTVRVNSGSAANSPLLIPVRLNVGDAALLTLSSSAISFGFQTGGSVPSPQTVTVGSTGVPLSFATEVTTQSGGQWLSAATTGNTTPATLTVSVNTAGLQPGAYQGRVRVIAPGAANTPQDLNVAFTVSQNALLVLSPQTVVFTTQVGGTQPAPQTVAVTSTGNPLPFTVASTTSNNGDWLLIGPTGGTTPRNLNIIANPAGLAVGVYTGTVTVSADGVPNSPQQVQVRLEVTSGASLEVAPATLSFTRISGGPAPPAQTLTVSSSSSALNYTVSAAASTGGGWLSATPQSGSTTGQVQVTAGGADLAPGTYNGTVTITSAGAANSPRVIPVTLTVTPPQVISVTPNLLTFSAQAGGAAPAAQPLTVTTSAGPADFTVATSTATGGPWLAATPAEGTTPGTISVSVNQATLAAGTYTGSVTITVPGAQNNPAVISVQLTVTGSPLTAAPTSLAFAYDIGGPVPAVRPLDVIAGGANVGFTAEPFTESGGNWLTVTPTSGTTPSTLSVGINIAALTPGSFTGAVRLRPTGGGVVSVPVTLTVTAALRPAITNFVNAASQTPTPVAAGMIFTVYGANIGPATPQETQIGPNGRVTTTLGNVRVLFDGTPAPLTYVSSSQINGVAPYSIANRFGVRVEVEYLGVRSLPIDIRVEPAAPGIFTLDASGRNQGAVLNQNGTVNSSVNTAARGEVIVIYATGEGQTNPPGIDGAVTGGSPPRPLLPVGVLIGGIEVPAANIQYAGSAPSLVAGALQVNVVIPLTAPVGGSVPLQLRVGGTLSPLGVTIGVR